VSAGENRQSPSRVTPPRRIRLPYGPRPAACRKASGLYAQPPTFRIMPLMASSPTTDAAPHQAPRHRAPRRVRRAIVPTRYRLGRRLVASRPRSLRADSASLHRGPRAGAGAKRVRARPGLLTTLRFHELPQAPAEVWLPLCPRRRAGQRWTSACGSPLLEQGATERIGRHRIEGVEVCSTRQPRPWRTASSTETRSASHRRRGTARFTRNHRGGATGAGASPGFRVSRVMQPYLDATACGASLEQPAPTSPKRRHVLPCPRLEAQRRPPEQLLRSAPRPCLPAAHRPRTATAHQ
jgi:hypothetical protein